MTEPDPLSEEGGEGSEPELEVERRARALDRARARRAAEAEAEAADMAAGEDGMETNIQVGGWACGLRQQGRQGRVLSAEGAGCAAAHAHAPCTRRGSPARSPRPAPQEFEVVTLPSGQQVEAERMAPPDLALVQVRGRCGGACGVPGCRRGWLACGRRLEAAAQGRRPTLPGQ